MLPRPSVPGPPSDAEALAPGAALVVHIVGWEPEHRERLGVWSRAGRALRLLAGAAHVRIGGRRVRMRLRRAGLRVERIPVGRPRGGREIGLGRRPVAAATQEFVLGSRERRGQSVVEEVKAQADRVIGAATRVQRGRVLASGIVMVELSAGADRYMLRIAGPAGARDARAAAGVLAQLLQAAPPAAVRNRLVEPLAGDATDGFTWWLEQARPGSHPRRVRAGLWESCEEFLAQLRQADAPATADVEAPIRASCEAISLHASAAQRPALDRLGQRLAGELAGIRLGWAHGDFHPGNLLAQGSGLGTVLDWDAGGPAALPLLDLLHLVATEDPRLRRLTHGDRCTDHLWPLARAGGDARIESYCDRTGTPRERDVLVALSQAYWLVRVADDVRRFGGRVARLEWIERNLRQPLTVLMAADAGGRPSAYRG